MTDGEKMIWAAAYALEFQRCRDESLRAGNLSPEVQSIARRAALFADGAVNTLRFGVQHTGFALEMIT